MQELATTAPQRRGRDRWVRIELALVIAEATGARIGSINGLRWSDISFDPPRIRWRQEFDKRGRERMIPLPVKLTKELKRFKLRLGGNDDWLFPRNDGVRPWPREIFDQQLREAEKLAGLERMVGGVWHPWRRAWATARKNMPIVDVAAAGGWKDYPTLLKCYQHTDEQSMLRVMECATKVWVSKKRRESGEKRLRNDYIHPSE